MKAKIIGAGIAAIIVVAAIVVVFYETEASPYYETENQFGSWGEEILIEYEDGSTDSLKLLETSAPPGALTYGGKSINTVYYRLKAKATGTGYDEACIKITNFVVDIKILKGTSTIWSSVKQRGTSTHGVPVDGQYHLISAKAGDNFADIFKEKKWAPGTYTIKFTPASSSDPIYWGEPGQSESDGKRINLPSGKTITVVWTTTLTVVLGAEIET
jgi:hypothetical protein